MGLSGRAIDSLTKVSGFEFREEGNMWLVPGNTKGGSITVPLTSCLTGLD